MRSSEILWRNLNYLSDVCILTLLGGKFTFDIINLKFDLKHD